MSAPIPTAPLRLSALGLVAPIHTTVKGRARFHVAGLQRRPPLKIALEQALTSTNGIQRASADVCTGNVLVVFDPALGLQYVIASIEVVIHAMPASAAHAEPKPITARSCERASPLLDPRRIWHGLRSLLHPNHPAPDKDQGQPRPDASAATALAREKTPLWHLLSGAEIARTLGTSANEGLSASQASDFVRRYGLNELARPRPRSVLRVFLNQFLTLPVALLAGSAVLSIATGGAADAAVIMLVVLLNATIGCATELQAEKTLSSLTQFEEPRAKVIRDGVLTEIGAPQITVGDVFVLTRGDYIAADARVISIQDLTVAESILTGESMPVTKTIEPLPNPMLPLGDRTNMVYRGTIVTGGSGRAIVVAVGNATEIGQIQALITEAVRPETPMERQLGELGRQLVLASCVICGVVFVIGLLRRYSFLGMLKSAVSLAVSAIPEGLPTVATTTLAFGVWRMRKQNILARHLDAIETLGAVEVICLDKTGTLTMNRMSVVEAFIANKRLLLKEGAIVEDGAATPSEIRRLIYTAVLCNEAELVEENGTSVLKGTPTENALIELALKWDIDVNALRRCFPLMTIDQRTETRNYMASLHRAGDGRSLLAVKGSPVEVLQQCRWQSGSRRRHPLTPVRKARIEAENERMAAAGRRVLGLAYREVNDRDLNRNDLVWAGLVGIADPTREGVDEVIRTFHQAGIATRMITGDQRSAAYAIGNELGLSRVGRKLQVIDSTEIRNGSATLNGDMNDVHIFARVSPSDKLQIVQALRQNGKVVAMTGDGVNDAPALKAADVGIAMGKEGADTAREVADIVLLEDDLRSMVTAVREGRTIYENIQKAVHYITATNLTEVLTVLASVGAGLGQPLTPRQLLWINVLSDVFPGLALAVEPAHADVMKRPPRDPKQPLISRADYIRLTRQSAVITAAGIGGYLYGLLRYGAGPRSTTLSFLTLTTAQLLHTTSARSPNPVFGSNGLPPNKYIPMAIGGGLALEFLALLLPPLRAVLGLAPIGVMDAIVSLACATATLVVNESSKALLDGSGGQQPLPEADIPPAAPQFESA